MEIKNIEFSYGKNKVLDDISFKIAEGKITTLIGANGCGKSTLFNVITKNLKPQKGSVELNSKNTADIRLKDFAKQVAIVHQYNTAPSDLTVEKLISYGRIAHCGLKRDKDEDERCVNFAMEVTGVSAFAKKQISQLSGGQRQRVWIAVALAQNTKILFLDEPTTYLDIRYQIEILRLVKKLNREYGITIVMVLHDINQSIAYSDNIIAMKNGKIIAQGEPESIITEELIKTVYGIELVVKNIENNKVVLTV
jgi:iron complex transport system ATP-binding protein